MSNQAIPQTNLTPVHPRVRLASALVGVLIFSGCIVITGCQDGPLYALKKANPYYAMHEWKLDEEIGVTDRQRMEQLDQLGQTIAQMPAERQQYWAQHLEQMLANDPSPEMRRMAVVAAGRIQNPSALALLEQGLDDESIKVRMQACSSLGTRSGDEAARLLASTIGTETSLDVRHSAMAALGQSKSPVAIDSLRVALSDRDPATRTLAVNSLRGATGKNYGDDPDVWIAALDGKPAAEAETRIADRIRDLF